MSASPPKIQLSTSNASVRTLQAFEDLINYIEPFVDQSQTDIQVYILELKNEISQLKNKKKTRASMIHATANDLRTAFNRHYDTFQEIEEICSYLLLFYAVECGLKSILLRQRRLTRTDQLNDSLISHNFEPLIKELRLPRSVVGNIGYTNDTSQMRIPGFRLDRDKSSWSMSEAHQAWRYGVRVHSEDELKVIEWLNKVCAWIKDNQNR